jgi:hypothetical protein
MNNDARRLVDHDEIRVLVNDRERLIPATGAWCALGGSCECDRRLATMG